MSGLNVLAPSGLGSRSRTVLRPYQVAAIDRITAMVARGLLRIMLACPTGAGKTVIAGALAADAVARGQRALFLCHRRELVQQAVRKLFDVGIDAGIIAAGSPLRPGQAAQVATIQTLHARAVQSPKVELPSANLVIVDEAHHASAKTWRRLIDAYPKSIVIGLSATPCRQDGRGLGSIFQALVEVASVGELVADGFLVSAKVYAPVRPDLTGVHVRRGDYIDAELSVQMNTDQLVGDVVEHWLRLAQRRRTVVFAVDVSHSVHIRDEFRRAGVLAEHIDGSTPAGERDRILAQLAVGITYVVTNCQLLTEGWDCPEVSCVVLARPTKSLGLYRQMVGRTLRPTSGKADALILDHAGAVFQHGFIDDPIEWELGQDRRACNNVHQARGQYGAPALVTCPECSAVRLQGQPCQVCGWQVPKKGRAVDFADGELAVVGRDRQIARAVPSRAEQLVFYRQLLQIAEERHRKRGWVDHTYLAKYGDWPPRSWKYQDTIAAEPAVRAWVRHRDIAFARLRQKSQ
jgi:DNA repair protein RadD